MSADQNTTEVESIEVNPSLSKEIIQQRLHFYHGTTPRKWESIRREGVILSESELLARGLLSKDDLEDFDSTSTGDLDRQAGNDQFVFCSVSDENYGNIVLELNPNILSLPGAVINTAGDYLHFVNDPELEEYYQKSQIPASMFLDHLFSYINSLPDPEWFFGKKDGKFDEFFAQAFTEKSRYGKTEKFKILLALHPEIKIPKELPLSHVLNIVDHAQKGDDDS